MKYSLRQGDIIKVWPFWYFVYLPTCVHVLGCGWVQSLMQEGVVSLFGLKLFTFGLGFFHAKTYVPGRAFYTWVDLFTHQKGPILASRTWAWDFSKDKRTCLVESGPGFPDKRLCHFRELIHGPGPAQPSLF